MTTSPRTDGVVFQEAISKDPVVPAEFARSLERELDTIEQALVKTQRYAEDLRVCRDALQQTGISRRLRIEEIEPLYYALIYAVARKFDGESRHETALRYIREAEANATTGPAVDADLERDRASHRADPVPETDLE